MFKAAVRFFSTGGQGGKEILSERAQAIADKLGLGAPKDLRIINKKLPDRFASITIRTSKRHTIKNFHYKYLCGPEHPLTDMYLSFYADRPMPPLVVYTNAFKNGGAKSVVRNRARTRLRRAFYVALTKNGYNWLGTGISKELNTQGTHLYGTVQLHADLPKRIWEVEFTEIVHYFDHMIKNRIAPALGKKINERSGPS